MLVEIGGLLSLALVLYVLKFIFSYNFFKSLYLWVEYLWHAANFFGKIFVSALAIVAAVILMPFALISAAVAIFCWCVKKTFAFMFPMLARCRIEVMRPDEADVKQLNTYLNFETNDNSIIFKCKQDYLDACEILGRNLLVINQ